MMIGRAVLLAVVVLLPRAEVPAQERSFDPAQGKPAAYKDAVRPLLAKYCAKCHGAVKPKAKLNLDAYPDEASVLQDRKTWKRVLDQMHAREMPPDDKPQPTPAERDLVTSWIEEALERVEPGVPRDPGRVVLRRLNRVEYRNTLQELLGVDFNPTADFPSDDVGYGFDNIGDVLSIPPLLMEKYLAAAERVVDRTVQTPEQFRPRTRRLETKSLQVTGGGQLEGETVCMFGPSELQETVDVALEGTYVVRVRASGDPAAGEAPRMSLRVDGKEQKSLEVNATRRDPRVYEEKLVLGAGRRKVGIAFVNDYYNPEALRARDRDRNLYVDSVELHGPVDGRIPEPPEAHRRLFVAAPSAEKPKREAASGILSRFLPLAFRRPLREGELERFLRLFDLAEKQGDSFEAAMKVPLLAALVSPHFLFRVERDLPGADPKGVRRLDDWELAGRLSYFLWSSMPDAELFAAAREGKLSDPAGLEAQVRRMLRDPRSRALAENFAVQWLQLRRLETQLPDPKRFPSFDEPLRKAMLEEAVLLFDAVVREDRSVMDLLGADFTFLNARLARHYGIPGVEGPEMRRVALSDPRRGGVLTMAAVLTATSNPTRTAAVKRGKWVLETILGTPPPPPLPDAGELKDETAADRKLSLRQRLEKHRADPSCAACHRKMDPIGFGFENYDAIGAWRDQEEGRPIDTAATLPDGSSFGGPVDLKNLLLRRKDDYVRCLAEKMLTFALGRGVEYYDSLAVKEIRKRLADKEFRMSALVLEVAKSYPFQHRRNRSKGAKDD
jgi:mono/diheme cytochrome c family protein